MRLFRGDDGGLIKRAQVTRLNGTKGGRVRFEKQTKYNTLITRVRYTLYGQTCAYEWVSWSYSEHVVDVLRVRVRFIAALTVAPEGQL